MLFPMVGAYWREVARRALCEALGVLQITSRERVVLSVVITGVGLLALAAFGSAGAFGDQLVYVLALTIFIVLSLLAIFAWKLVSVPAKMASEAKDTIQGLRQKLVVNFGPERISLVQLAEIARTKHGWTWGE